MWPRKAAAAVSSGDQVVVHKVRFLPPRDYFRYAFSAFAIQPLHLQRLSKPLLTMPPPSRKFFIYTATGMVCWYTWTTIATLPLRNLDLKDLPEIEEDEEEDPLFIPFPFTEKQVQPPPYAGKEEEWQSFVAFNNDRDHRNRAKHDLAMMVKKTVDNNSGIKRWAKKDLQLTLGPTWLIITYPDRPPPEFVRTG